MEFADYKPKQPMSNPHNYTTQDDVDSEAKWTQERLQAYIDNGIEESLTLDYKAAPALDRTDSKKKEITKDISSMANSAGGILIYGIAEYPDEARKHLPERIDPISRKQFPKEWIESIASNIHPRINDLCIIPVSLQSDGDHVAYVVVVPQSTTAHQATDWRYYKRYNFQSIPMEDHEVRDVMGRDKHPKVSLEFLLVRETFEARSEIDFVLGRRPTEEYYNTLQLRVYGRNDGSVLAQYVHGDILIPTRLCDVDAKREIVSIDEEPYYRYIVNNERREIIGFEGAGFLRRPNLGPIRFEPVLRGTRKYLEEDIALDDAQFKAFGENDVIHWAVTADNADVNSGVIRIVDIATDDKTYDPRDSEDEGDDL